MHQSWYFHLHAYWGGHSGMMEEIQVPRVIYLPFAIDWWSFLHKKLSKQYSVFKSRKVEALLFVSRHIWPLLPLRLQSVWKLCEPNFKVSWIYCFNLKKNIFLRVIWKSFTYTCKHDTVSVVEWRNGFLCPIQESFTFYQGGQFKVGGGILSA